MKPDRELLELAARAAGIEIVEWSCIEESCDAIARLEDMRLHKWNPLTDDGDALRLAVKLRLGIGVTDGEDGYAYAMKKNIMDCDETGEDCESIRRAIVRAAAAIGETL